MEEKSGLTSNEMSEYLTDIHKKKISFLIGAGCEGNGQLGLPMGEIFKRDTIVAKDVSTLISAINGNQKNSIKNGTIISHNSYNILYQTIIENDIDKFEFNKDNRKTVEKYLYLKDDGSKFSEEEKNDIRHYFQEIYKKIYKEITDEKFDIDNLKPEVKYFLENACFYAFVDSCFNYLRKPEKYRREKNRVVKLYYAAYKSILEGIADKKGKKEINDIKKTSDCIVARKRLIDFVEEMQNRIIELHSNDEKLYYNIIKKFKNDNQEYDISVTTTNYTYFAEKMINLPEDDISYIHGRLELFESLKTKRVDILTNFEEDDFVFPFIFVQSGVKPIVSGYQIKECEKARKMITESDILIILGYGINSDDEHITNLLRERIRSKKRTICLIHEFSEIKINNVKKKLFCKNEVEFRDSNDLADILEKLKE